MLVPAPLPPYTLAPGVSPLDEGQRAALEACLAALTGRVGGVVVTAVGTTATHHVIELMTSAGAILVLERAGCEAAATLVLTGAAGLD